MRSHILQLCRFLLTTSAILNCRTLPEPFRHQRSQQHQVFKPDQSPESRHKLRLYCSPSHGHLCKGMILQPRRPFPAQRFGVSPTCTLLPPRITVTLRGLPSLCCTTVAMFCRFWKLFALTDPNSTISSST